MKRINSSAPHIVPRRVQVAYGPLHRTSLPVNFGKRVFLPKVAEEIAADEERVPAEKIVAEGTLLAVVTAEQWMTVFDGGVPPGLVNPAAWSRYQARFHAAFGVRPADLP